MQQNDSTGYVARCARRSGRASPLRAAGHAAGPVPTPQHATRSTIAVVQCHVHVPERAGALAALDRGCALRLDEPARCVGDAACAAWGPDRPVLL